MMSYCISKQRILCPKYNLRDTLKPNEARDYGNSYK